VCSSGGGGGGAVGGVVTGKPGRHWGWRGRLHLSTSLTGRHGHYIDVCVQLCCVGANKERKPGVTGTSSCKTREISSRATITLLLKLIKMDLEDLSDPQSFSVAGDRNLNMVLLAMLKCVSSTVAD